MVKRTQQPKRAAARPTKTAAPARKTPSAPTSGAAPRAARPRAGATRADAARADMTSAFTTLIARTSRRGVGALQAGRVGPTDLDRLATPSDAMLLDLDPIGQALAAHSRMQFALFKPAGAGALQASPQDKSPDDWGVIEKALTAVTGQVTDTIRAFQTVYQGMKFVPYWWGARVHLSPRAAAAAPTLIDPGILTLLGAAAFSRAAAFSLLLLKALSAQVRKDLAKFTDPTNGADLILYCYVAPVVQDPADAS